MRTSFLCLFQKNYSRLTASFAFCFSVRPVFIALAGGTFVGHVDIFGENAGSYKKLAVDSFEINVILPCARRFDESFGIIVKSIEDSVPNIFIRFKTAFVDTGADRDVNIFRITTVFFDHSTNGCACHVTDSSTPPAVTRSNDVFYGIVQKNGTTVG